MTFYKIAGFFNIMRRFNAFELKLFLALLMVLDHIDHIPGLLPAELSGLFHVLTRCVGTFFAYLAVEGFVHTHSRPRYALRLFGWAAFMAAGNAVYNAIANDPRLHLSNNIFLTLALGVLMLCILAGTQADKPAGHPALRILGVLVVLAVGAVFAEGGIVVLPFMLVTYLCRKRPALRNVLYLLGAIALFFLSYVPYPTVHETLLMLSYNSDFLFITVLPFIWLYDGTRGPNTPFCKYFFYVFYPLHLWVIGLIALVMR